MSDATSQALESATWPEVVGMPVNYFARYQGLFGRFLDTLDNIEETRPTVRLPVSATLRDLSEMERHIVDSLLWRLLVNAYRSGLLP